MSDPVKDFAEDLDDLRAIEDVRERDAADAGERRDIDDVIREHGFDPSDFASS